MPRSFTSRRPGPTLHARVPEEKKPFIVCMEGFFVFLAFLAIFYYTTSDFSLYRAMKLSIITVTWNSAELIEQQLLSVKKAARNIAIEQIVVDNASRDRTVACLRGYSDTVTLIANTENMGFGGGNRQGARIATGEYLLFLNPDMRLEEGSLDTIVAWMDRHSDVGIVSPKLVDEHGTLNADAQPRRFPRLWEQLALLVKLPHLFPHLLDAYHMKGFDADIEQEVDSVRGSFMLMRREFVDALGWPFDPRYFIWYEDVDICREAKRLGYKVVHTPIITAVDYVGQSFKQRTTLWKQQQFTKSMLQYFQKWEPWYKWMWIALLRPLAIFMARVNDMFYKRENK